MAAPLCGAAKKSDGTPCRRPAGWGTDHPGAGRCKLHGGLSPTKHGLYSKHARGRTGEILAEVTDAEAADPTEEIKLASAQLAAALEKLDEGDEEAQLEWYKAISLHVARLTLAKQRQWRLADSLSREEFVDYLSRLMAVVKAFVPADDWEKCEQAIALVPVWLDGPTDTA